VIDDFVQIHGDECPVRVLKMKKTNYFILFLLMKKIASKNELDKGDMVYTYTIQ
jgi:hypothetical protein